MRISIPAHRLITRHDGLFTLLVVVGIVLAWSLVNPHDGPTWLLEAAPVLIGVPLLIASQRRFRFSILAYRLMALHAIILLVGAHYTYAEVPFFNWLREYFDLGRNHYDRLGHFAQGFVPAILTRELLLRCSPLRPGRWLFFLTTCTVLAISAFYEMIEWWTALATEDGAVAFLGTQGDPWDTQWDMFLALLGAISAQGLLRGVHDRAMAAIAQPRGRSRARRTRKPDAD